MILIDKLAYSSGLRKKSPGVKAAVAVLTIGILLISRSIASSLVTFLVMGGLTLFWGKTSFRYYTKLLAIPVIFLLFSSVAIVTTVSRTPLLEYSVSVGSLYLSTCRADLLRAVQVMSLSLGSVSCLYFLILSTPMADLIGVLNRIHTPKLMIELMLLMYRFIFLLLDLAAIITTAQNCRLGNGSYRMRMKGMAQMLSAVLIKSLQKSRAIYNCMEARGYDGEIRVLQEEYKAAPKEYVAAVLWIIILILTVIAGKGWQG